MNAALDCAVPSDEHGLFRLRDFVRSVETSSSVEADTIEYFHRVFSNIIDEIQDLEKETYILKTDDRATGEILAKHLNLWTGKTLNQQRQEEEDIAFSWACVRIRVALEEANPGARVSDAKIVSELARERGCKTGKKMEALRKKVERARIRLDEEFRKVLEQ